MNFIEKDEQNFYQLAEDFDQQPDDIYDVSSIKVETQSQFPSLIHQMNSLEIGQKKIRKSRRESVHFYIKKKQIKPKRISNPLSQYQSNEYILYSIGEVQNHKEIQTK